MSKCDGENACRITGPRTPPWLTAWSELVLETCNQVAECMRAQLDANCKAMEASVQLILTRNPQEFVPRVNDYWQRSLDCLWPMTEIQWEAARFLAAVGNHVASGLPTVGEAVYQRRLAVCEECEFFQDNHCLQCGCRLAGDVFAKARWRGETCPLGRWPR